jgi:hypothetical protein
MRIPPDRPVLDKSGDKHVKLIGVPMRSRGGYVDRILNDKSADLPVRAPPKYEFMINLKTAEGARPYNAGHRACSRRRGDRMTVR